MSNFKIILSLMKRDLLYSYKKNIIKNLLIILGLVLIVFASISKLNSLGTLNIGEIIFDIFKGVPYNTDFNVFNFPSIWFIVNNCIIFIIGSYVDDDFKLNGVYLVTRCNRKKIWTSKILWGIANVIIYYMLLALGIIIINKILNISWSDYIVLENMTISTSRIIYYTIILYVTTSISLSIIHNTFSVIFSPKYSYMILIFIMLISVFTKSNLMPAQHSLLLRHIPFDSTHDLTIADSVLYNLILSGVFVVIGRKLISHKDIL